MPIYTQGKLRIDYSDEGSGPAVILLHSSVSGNRQWRALIDALKDRYRVLAPNLYGYGETTPWPGPAAQSLYAQAQLVLALCGEIDGPVRLVGHSFGGAVALKAASLLGARAQRLVLLEANPVNLLEQAGRGEAYLEARALRDHVQCFGSLGDWAKVAERFADYWIADGAWAAMPEKRRAAFVAALPPNLHEWDAVMNEKTTIEEWRQLAARTLVVSDAATRRPVRELAELFAQACPHWSFRSIEAGGHMAPLLRPDLVNPIVCDFLDAKGT